MHLQILNRRYRDGVRVIRCNGLGQGVVLEAYVGQIPTMMQASRVHLRLLRLLPLVRGLLLVLFRWHHGCDLGLCRIDFSWHLRTRLDSLVLILLELWFVEVVLRIYRKLLYLRLLLLLRELVSDLHIFRCWWLELLHVLLVLVSNLTRFLIWYLLFINPF